MYRPHITRSIAGVRVADLRPTAARDRPTTPARPRHQLHVRAAVLIAIGALAPATGALAQPAGDAGLSTVQHATAVALNHHRRATPGPITFTNPLGRTRGPGAGAG